MIRIKFETRKATLVFVKVPEDGAIFKLTKIGNCLAYKPNCIYGFWTLLDDFCYKGFKCLGLIKDLSRGQKKKLVSHYSVNSDFMDYRNPQFTLETADQSFQSIMSHCEIFSVNPFGEKVEEKTFKKLVNNRFYTFEEALVEFERFKERSGSWVLIIKYKES